MAEPTIILDARDELCIEPSAMCANCNDFYSMSDEGATPLICSKCMKEMRKRNEKG